MITTIKEHETVTIQDWSVNRAIQLSILYTEKSKRVEGVIIFSRTNDGQVQGASGGLRAGRGVGGW